MLLDRKEHKNVIGSERAEILLSHPFAHAEDSRYLAIRSGAKPADHLYATKWLEDKQRDKKTAPQRTELIDDSLMKRARKYVGVVLKDLHSWSDPDGPGGRGGDPNGLMPKKNQRADSYCQWLSENGSRRSVALLYACLSFFTMKLQYARVVPSFEGESIAFGDADLAAE